MTDVLATNAFVIAGLMLAIWLVSLPLRDVSVVDIGWGLGFVLVGWSSLLNSSSAGPSRWLIVVMTTVWGCRLSGYLAWRNLGHGEDRRYAAMRTRWGRAFPLVSLATVFALQGAVMWVVSLPVQAGIAQSHGGWSLIHGMGVSLWGIGLYFEAVGDWQLARFKAEADNAGRVCDRGLWRYTRHPNYFGDFCVWWGLYVVAVAGGASWWTIVGPAVMSVFLMFVSGVALLERDLKSRKPEYVQYVRRTNAFFPWSPRVDG